LKKKLLIIAILIFINVKAQENKTVTLTVTGTGKTHEVAKTNALRSAIEQAFGAFISSKTEILNDDLVKDEIVSVTNGNIQKIEIISELQIPDGGYATSIKVTVSVSKLISFVESKGFKVEFKGGLFASNILIQELNEKNEIMAIDNMLIILNELANKSFDYTISAEEPYSEKNKWSIPIKIDVFANINFINLSILLEQTLKGLNMNESDLINYSKLKKEIYPITIALQKKSGIYYLRSNQSRIKIYEFIYNLRNYIFNFKISNGISNISLKNYLFENNKENLEINDFKLDDTSFRIIATIKGKYLICGKSLFYYKEGFNNREQLYPLFYNVKSSDFSLNIHSDRSKNRNSGFEIGHGSKIFKDLNFTFDKNFKPLKSIMLSNEISTNYGLVMSFFGISPSSKILEFQFKDIKTIDEIKQISKYEIIKN
jgi:hypothetical protein